MDNQDNIKKYLVTEAVDTSKLPKSKLDQDLAILEKFEQKSNYKTDISIGIENPALSRAMKALQLSNPFKGY